jgi:pyruvate kinase
MAVTTQVDLLLNRCTKIIATVGPASASEKVLTQLVLAGVNVFRLNMSHGDHSTHQTVFRTIQAVAKKLELPIAVLADLCGPKIRTGRFINDQIVLEKGTAVTISTTADIGTEGLIVSQYPALATDVKPGNRILLADGVLELEVVSTSATEVKCQVIHGGELGNNKGINLPGVDVSAPGMTPKDYEDARFAINLGVDFIALSFVRTAQDVERLRSLLDQHECQTRIVAKIEKPEALENVEAILDATDAIMIARGDLGVELPPEQVPAVQGQLIKMAAESGTPVIVATQMLESMIQHSRPTRAEVTDVSHAVEGGVDAVMLSAETAAGSFPVEAVEMMDRIIRQTEAELWNSGEYGISVSRPDPPIPVWSVIADTTSRMSRDLMARAVMVVTRSGNSAEIVSTARPASPIVGITNDEAVYRRLCLRWGVLPILDEAVGSVNPNELARSLAVQLDLAEPGEYVLLVRGFHGEQVLNLPSVTVVEI